MEKILKLASIKQQVRERDLQEELNEQPGANKKKNKQDSGAGDQGNADKDIDVALDPFFVAAENIVDEGDNNADGAEKRVVMRDGRVPKFQKNLVKME